MSDDPLKAFLGSVPDYVRIQYAGTRVDGDREWKIVVLDFAEKGFGFGEIGIYVNDLGQVAVDTESMGKAAAVKFFRKLIESAIDDTDMDPERHALYNEIRGQRCGHGCIACYPEPTVQ